MSELVNSLNQIYNTKLAIKEVIGTDSNNFSEYPALIEERISYGVSGTSYITANGEYDISTYESVNINVPVPPGYVFPTGTYNITGNGTYVVSGYQSAYVSVPGGSVAVLGDLSVSENGEYSASSYSYDGFDTVTVNVPIDWDEVQTYGYVLPSGTQIITSNGTWNVKSNAYAFVQVEGGSTSVTVEGQYLIGKGGSVDEYTINRGFYYVYDDNTSTYYTLAEPLGNQLDRPKLGDTVSVTGTILNGNVIEPTSYSVTATPAYQYVDLSNFELYGTGDKEIAYVVNAIGAADRRMTYDNKWGYYPGGDYYNIIADSVSNISFTAGNDITAYVISESVYEDGYYGYTYYIRDIVKNQSPIITGLDYSIDHGENWNSMSLDTSEMVYPFDGISISDGDMVSISFRAHLDGGGYMYFGDTSIELTSPATTVIADLNKSRNSMLSVGIMNQTMSAGTLSGEVSTTDNEIMARITS